jgi:molybdopterin/thiamine biosynthesis adenylyltransferase
MPFSTEEIERYARHLVLREIGGPGQQKLKAARVLIVGAGGLGAPAALYLAAAGCGFVGIADPDHVALSNLQRQVLYATADVGRPKVEAAAAVLRGLNPHVQVETHPFALKDGSAEALIADYDLVLDGTDSFASKLIINAACRGLGRPLISGALGRWTGQVALFEGRPCYQCLMPEAPPEAETCAAVGVVGALAGAMGSMMALEAVKRITGAGRSLAGRLMIFDGLTFESRTVGVAPDPACPVCGGASAFAPPGPP